jgi:hypothetical protein
LPPASWLGHLSGNRPGFATAGGVLPLRATLALHAPRDRLLSLTAAFLLSNLSQGKEGSISHL